MSEHLMNLEDMFDVSKSDQRYESVSTENMTEVALATSSKGNQRKWYDKEHDRYVKEQFCYQGVYWDDWKVECISSAIASQMNTDVAVLKQVPVRINSSTMGVVSENFCELGESYISFNRILKKYGYEYDQNMFPLDKFKFIVDTVGVHCNLDIAEYLVVMSVMDYILLNEDRHLNNFGVIQTPTGFRLAPLFDFGLGLFEHDKKFAGRSYDNAYARVNGKPFSDDMVDIIMSLSRSEYRDLLQKVIPTSLYLSSELIPNSLAATHLDVATQKLKELFYDLFR